MTNHIPDDRDAEPTAYRWRYAHSDRWILRSTPVVSNDHVICEPLYLASALPKQAPGHTDLMVSPESIDAFMEKNPLPKQADPSREALAIEVMNVRRRIHGLDDLDLATLRRIKRDAGINEAFAIADALIARLAAKSVDDGVREALAKELQSIGITNHRHGSADGSGHSSVDISLDLRKRLVETLSLPSPGERT